MSLDDIVKRNQRAMGSGRKGVLGMIADEIDDPTADSADIKNRILAIAIVVGLILTIVVLAKVL